MKRSLQLTVFLLVVAGLASVHSSCAQDVNLSKSILPEQPDYFDMQENIDAQTSLSDLVSEQESELEAENPLENEGSFDADDPAQRSSQPPAEKQDEQPTDARSERPDDDDLLGEDDDFGSDEELNDDQPEDDIANDILADSMPRAIQQISLSTHPVLPTPTRRPLPMMLNAMPTRVAPKLYQWQADNVGYKNLLFEEPALERHGYCRPGQSIRSGVLFLGRAVILPADLIKGHHNRCDNPLGWGQPGNYPR